MTADDRVMHRTNAAVPKMAAIGPLCLFMAFTPAVRAQDTTGEVPPLVEVWTDKLTYRLHEPVVLTVRLTNRSDRRHVYFALDPLAGPYFKIRITDPDGLRVGMYYRPSEGVSGPSRAANTPPDSSRTESVLISHFYPLTASQGIYEVEVSMNPFDGPESTQPAPVTLHLPVIAPGDRRLLEEVVEPYGRAVAVVRGIHLVNQKTLDAFARVISSPEPAVAYLRVPAIYYLGEANMRLGRLLKYRRAIEHVGSGRPLDDAESGFAELRHSYPESPFADLAAAGISTIGWIRRAVGRKPERQD
jgi:hypothetical protein